MWLIEAIVELLDISISASSVLKSKRAQKVAALIIVGIILILVVVFMLSISG